MATTSIDVDVGVEADISKEKDKGLVKIIKRLGTGTENPGKGDTVFVHYVGTLVDGGAQFDSSRERGEEFSFTLGRGSVIKGWDEGVATMKKGELATLICSADYAYGEMGSPPKIPPKAALDFEVELIRFVKENFEASMCKQRWEGEDISIDRDRSITRSTKIEGDGVESPNDGAAVKAHVIGTFGGKNFFEKDVDYLLGECTELGLPDGVDKALKRFKKGERSLITMTGKAGYGSKGRPEFNIPANAELVFDIQLNEFEKSKESWQMNDDEKLEEAELLKTKGTEFFKRFKFKLAIGKYSKIVDLLEHVDKLEDEVKKTKRDSLMLAAHLNLALCYVKQSEFNEAIKQAEKALAMDEDNVKALYRRASAFEGRKDWSEAMADFKRTLELEPDNKAALRGIQNVKAQLAVEKKKQMNTFGGMFDKFAAQDAKKAEGKKAEPVAAKEPTESTDEAQPAES